MRPQLPLADNRLPSQTLEVEVRKNPPAVGLTATKVKFRKPTSGRLPNQHQPQEAIPNAIANMKPIQPLLTWPIDSPTLLG